MYLTCLRTTCVLLLLIIYSSCDLTSAKSNSQKEARSNSSQQTPQAINTPPASNSTSHKGKPHHEPKSIKPDTFKYVEPSNGDALSDPPSNDIKESTKRIILRNQETPKIRVDTLRETIKLLHDQHKELPCSIDAPPTEPYLYRVDGNIKYAFSSSNTQKQDGAVFCLMDLNLSNTGISKIIYSRNEGGHYSDEIYILSIDKALTKAFTLPISFRSSTEGHELTIESEIKGQIITRKITERYGWSNLDPDALKAQARRETIQTYMLNSDGSIHALNESVRKFKIDHLFQ